MYHVLFTHRDSAAPHIDWRKSIVEPLGRHSRFYFGNASRAPTHRELTGAATTASDTLYAELSPAAREFGYTYQLFPNAFLFPWSDYLVLARLHPLGVERCRIAIDHYGVPPETDAEAAAMQGRIAFNAQVMREDFALLPSIQRGLRSGGIGTMPLGYLELAVANFHATLDGYMAR
jgi:hypothetical protein